MQGIFVAAFYRYAKTKHASAGFRLENFLDGVAAGALAKSRSIIDSAFESDQG